ncbi:hypothetical protein JG688_00004841 [Phytophthora aleatoria]|uniref:Uncharacterized protein n=1 Tax=Phytophthora aleatoria TaxID=2496075 RepID=A0A8J5MH43_9STRA|nr:hypothetical protein JG688_00004841 [Phytophthora aleatoria]
MTMAQSGRVRFLCSKVSLRGQPCCSRQVGKNDADDQHSDDGTRDAAVCGVLVVRMQLPAGTASASRRSPYCQAGS